MTRDADTWAWLRRQRARNVAPFVLTVAAVLVFSLLSGGYILQRSSPVAIVYLLIAAVWVWFLRRRPRPSLLFLGAMGALGLFVAWAGFSVLWSFGPDLTWVAFNAAAFYLAVAALLGLTPVRALQLRFVAWGFLAVAVVVGVYAFLGKGLPDVVTHAHTFARLDSPIGYWNVLALMMLMGLVVGVSLAGDGRAHPAARVLAAAAGVPLCFTFFFTFSRGGWLAAAVALAIYFAFSTTRLASFVSLVVVVVPVAGVLWRLRGLATLYNATTDDALRTLQGHTLLDWSLIALVVVIAVEAGVVVLQRRVPWPRWAHRVAGVAVLVLVLAAGVGGGFRFVEQHGGSTWVKDRLHALVNDSDTNAPSNGPGRLLSLNSGRPPLWREALKQWRHDPVRGTGAGTFTFTNYRFRLTPGVVKHAHSQWFNVLSELGVVGLVLFAAAMVLLLAAAIRNPFADRRDPRRSLVVALQAGAVAFVVHMSWDWDWDMLAIGVVFFLFVATCSSYLETRRSDARRRAAFEAIADDVPVTERGGEAASGAEPAVESTPEPATGSDPVSAEDSVAAADRPQAAARYGRITAVAEPGAEAGPDDEVRASAGRRDVGPIDPAGDTVEPAAAQAAESEGQTAEPADEAEAPVEPDGGAADDDPAGEEDAAPAGFYADESSGWRRRPASWPWRVVACAALVVLAVSWLPPYLSALSEDAAFSALGLSDTTAALKDSQRAASLDPLAVRPLITESLILQQLGRNRDALAVLQAAAKLQPENYAVYSQLGALELGTFADRAAARAAFKRALQLNPLDAQSLAQLKTATGH